MYGVAHDGLHFIIFRISNRGTVQKKMGAHVPTAAAPQYKLLHAAFLSYVLRDTFPSYCTTWKYTKHTALFVGHPFP